MSRQPRTCKKGWTNAHDKLVELHVAYSNRDSDGKKAEFLQLIHASKLISNADAFPPSLRNYAADRKHSHTVRKRKGNTWFDPEFDSTIYAVFIPNKHITALHNRAIGIDPIPSSTPTMARSTTRIVTRHPSEDTAEQSFSNTPDDVDALSGGLRTS